MITDSVRATRAAALVVAALGGASHDFEWTARRAGGGAVRLHTSLCPLRADDGTIVGVVCLSFDTSAPCFPEVVTAALEKQDALITLVRDGVAFETVQALAGEDGQGPGDDAELGFLRRWLDHDPRPALERVICPLLAVFGEDDLMVPVAESARIFRATYTGHPEDLDIVTIPGADHRLQVGNPPALHPSYLPALSGLILQRLASAPG